MAATWKASGGTQGEVVVVLVVVVEEEEEEEEAVGGFWRRGRGNAGLGRERRQPPVVVPAPRPPLPLTDEERANLNKLALRMRLANVIAASLMITSAVLTILADSNATVSTLVVGIYVSCSAACSAASRRTWRWWRGSSTNFGFMYSAKGRFAFLVLLSTLCFTLDLIGKITGGLLCATAILNLYVICRFPQYEEECRAADMKGGGDQSIAMAGGAISGYVRAGEAVRDAATGAAASRRRTRGRLNFAQGFNSNNNNGNPPPPPSAGGGTACDGFDRRRAR